MEEEASPARKGTRARVESPLGERGSLLAYQVTADIGIVKSYIDFAACFASSARGLARFIHQRGELGRAQNGPPAIGRLFTDGG